MIKKIKIGIVVTLLLTIILGSIHCFTSDVGIKKETDYFENELFEWEDDFDRYVISHREINEQGYDCIRHYYISSSKAKLIYSEEEWTCFGEIYKTYNVYGRKINEGVSYFYINIYKGDQR